MSFTDEEVAYLGSQSLARFATVADDGQPDVVPVAYEFDGERFWVGGSGHTVRETRKMRNVEAGNRKVALVIDDMVSFDPFIVRSIRIYGEAGPLMERDGLVGAGLYMPIRPLVSWSWNMAGEPAADTWYEAHKTVHS